VVKAIVGAKETRLSGAVTAAADVNPDLRRRPSPVLIRLYELKAVAGFNTGDFMSLFQRDQAELGGDLLAREEFILQPGESRKLDRTLNEQTQFVGVFAAFRDIDRARWRVAEAVRVGSSQSWQIRVDAAGLSILPGK
jgi:type VI secretion system protein VasD